MELLEGPTKTVLIVGVILLVALVAGGLVWWEKRTKGGDRPPGGK